MGMRPKSIPPSTAQTIAVIVALFTLRVSGAMAWAPWAITSHAQI